MSERCFRDIKLFIFGPAEIAFRFFYGFRAGSVGVCLARALLWHPKAYDRMNADDRWFIFYLLSIFDSFLNGFKIVTVSYFGNVPAGRFETFCPILGKRQIG